jgi:hypothetical protein
MVVVVVVLLLLLADLFHQPQQRLAIWHSAILTI